MWPAIAHSPLAPGVVRCKAFDVREILPSNSPVANEEGMDMAVIRVVVMQGCDILHFLPKFLFKRQNHFPKDRIQREIPVGVLSIGIGARAKHQFEKAAALARFINQAVGIRFVGSNWIAIV